MKRLFINIKNSIFAILLVTAGLAEAKNVAYITAVEGNAFIHYDGGTTVQAQVGMKINDFGELITEEGGGIGLTTFFDQTYHLAGAGHIKLFNSGVELKRGYLWLKSRRDDVKSSFQTANSVGQYSVGEGVLSFDPAKSKTQFMSINGHFEFANNYRQDFTQLIGPGQFSFVAKDFEKGEPRAPTKIAESSFKKMTSLFTGIKERTKHSGPFPDKVKRIPAAIPTQKQQIKSGDWNFNGQKVEGHRYQYRPNKMKKKQFENNRKPVSEDGIIILKRSPAIKREPSSFSAKRYYNKTLKKLEKKKLKRDPRIYEKNTNIPIKIYGRQFRADPEGDTKNDTERTPSKTKNTRGRGPASIKAPPQVPTEVKMKMHMKQPGYMKDFNSSVVDEYKQQMRHSKEVNGLIDELKSVDMDYNQQY